MFLVSLVVKMIIEIKMNKAKEKLKLVRLQKLARRRNSGVSELFQELEQLRAENEALKKEKNVK